jgi:hypothetical protein
MAKSTKKSEGETFPPTTLRIDPELKYRADKLALENRRAGRPEGTIS